MKSMVIRPKTRLGKLVVEKYSHNGFYSVKCDCGVEFYESSKRLLSGAITQCTVCALSSSHNLNEGKISSTKAEERIG